MISSERAVIPFVRRFETPKGKLAYIKISNKMNATQERPVQSVNEQKQNLTPIAFQFSATRQDLNGVLIQNEPFIIAKDICDILELSNSRKAIASLDEDEKADVTISYTSSNGTIQNRKVKAINESGFYKLIFKSTKPEAKVFQKWVTSEVLPALRKTGFYGTAKKDNNFIDARTIPYVKVLINDIEVRMVIIDDVEYYSINDYHISINSRTSANQTAKKLNAVEILAKKIWLYGNTHPAWFATLKGLQLIASGSRGFNSSNQLVLSL